MTADGADMGTQEYKEAMKRGTIRKYLKARYKIIERESKTPPPWAIIDDEIKEEISQVFGDPKDREMKKGIKGVLHLSNFLQATGGTPKDKEARIKIFELVRPLFVDETGTGQDIARRLFYFMLNSQGRNIAECYRNGKITPELVAILNDRYEWTDELYRQHFLADRSFLLPYLIEEKKLDFTAYKREGDTGDEWYFNYKIRFSPLPFGAGNPPVTLEHIAEQADASHITLITSLKDAVKRALEGVKPTEKWLKEQLKISGEKVKQYLNEYIVKPVPAETLLQFAEATEIQYKQRQKERTRKDFSAPFASPHDTGFYVNPVTCQIHDLRPFTKELHALLSVNSWHYLKDFATAIREAVAEYNGEELIKEEPTKAELRKADKINYPVDKVNNNLWGTIENSPNGQLAFSTVKTGKKKEVTILAAINFVNMQGVKITKKLTNFDKRVYIAVAALWNAGNKVITLTQIHYAMGNTQRPAKYQLEKINEAVSKMTTAKLFLDNALEVEKLKYKYGKFKYDGALLPMERMTATIKGQLSDAAIHIFREPPLMTFARERNQITTFDVKLLQSPVSKTDGNLAIEDYLLERIAGAKNAAAKGKKVIINTILYETLFENAGIKSRMQKARAIDKIKTYLDYYKSNGYIKDYVAEANQVTFYF